MAARDEAERDRAAREPADAPGRVQPADAGAAEVDELERRHDDEHVDHALDQRARREHADEQPQPPVARNDAQPLERLEPKGARPL